MPVSLRRQRHRARMPTEGFCRSRRGNLWRRVGALTVSVYKLPDGVYGFCIADSDGPTYSRHVYGSEQDAIDALSDAMLDDFDNLEL